MSRNTNADILKSQCIKIIHGIIPNSKNNEEIEDRQESIRVKLFNLLNDFHLNMVEISTRIEKDKIDIEQTFFSKSTLSRSPKIELVSSEAHHKGQRPCIITFDQEHKIVYKPRDLRIDSLITGRQPNSLFQLISSIANELNFPTYQFLNKKTEGYGYTTFLSHISKDYKLNMNEMKQYYRMIGAIQAVSTVFGIQDLHRENVIVHNKMPHLIDLEVSFNLHELINQNGVTGLDDTIAVAHDIQDTDKLTSNNVVLIKDNFEIDLSTHLNDNYKEYRKEMVSGFKIVLDVFNNGNTQKTLLKFIDDLPGDLKLRFVPKQTRDLLPWALSQPLSKQDTMAEMLMDSQEGHLEYEQKDQIIGTQTKEDIIHSDIPYMHTNIEGNVYYKDVLFLQNKTGLKIKELIKNNVLNSKKLSIDNFLHTLDIKYKLIG